MAIRRVFTLGIAPALWKCGVCAGRLQIESTVDNSYAHVNPQDFSMIPIFSMNGAGGELSISRRCYGSIAFLDLLRFGAATLSPPQMHRGVRVNPREP